jgi:GxxExxY protein
MEAVMRHAQLTERNIGVCFDVMNELDVGFLEAAYHRALVIALNEAGLRVESQAAMKVSFRGR